jgi:isoleucyl-tRNA synthetase
VTHQALRPEQDEAPFSCLEDGSTSGTATRPASDTKEGDMADTDKVDYKSTMNLPQTDFPMRANLAQREPGWIEFWESNGLYQASQDVNEGGPLFVLHDGPPYANGDIHMGTAFNKVLKDLIVKYKTQRGFVAPYVPGWDCHGQPIEHMIEKKLGPEKMKQVSQAKIRELCRDWAVKFVTRQGDEFKRLGVRGDFVEPYLTLNHSYEAGDVKVFRALYERGMVYKGRKPIHWCFHCKTALAEAEIEYSDEVSDSIYVPFRFTEKPSAWAAQPGDASILIWTTTPWTLPANVAVTLAPDAAYVAVERAGELFVMAEALVESVAGAADWGEDYIVLPGHMRGRDLAGLTYTLPIHTDGTGVIITGDHVELTTGTGAVHTAPGHGEEDYLVGQVNGLPSPMPVDDDGRFDAGGGPFAGMCVDDANPRIVEWLRERGALVAAGKVTHSYPHCWRCKNPVIFRATEQWFVSMDAAHLRDHALKAINEVTWVPGWSINRISAMVADRPDWCISRQRAWGVPIPVFSCVQCGETVATPETFDAVERLFSTEGADAWFIKRPSEYLPAGTACSRCGCTELKPESDIVDVWFESGSSHTSVLEARPELRRPADLYLEGSDQHRGWFQSSLLTSVGAYDAAPFETVLTHGFIVDGDGRKMSKSLGNTVDPLDVVEKYGADIIRLWVASADYGQDVSVSDEILDRTSEAYRRIRNTFRFLLSNLYDYDPAEAVAWEEMEEVDRWALARTAQVADDVGRFYDDWSYHRVFHTLYQFFVTDLSAFYLDVLKDRLYADAAAGRARRSAQTALAAILNATVRLVAPVLTFTSEEVFQAMPEALRGGAWSVQLSGWAELGDVAAHRAQADALLSDYAVIDSVRQEALRVLEVARNEKIIGKSQEARLVLTVPKAVVAVLSARDSRALADLFIASEVDVVTGPDDTVSAEVAVAEGSKCPRCWNIRTDAGADAERPDLCARCAVVVGSL